MRVCLKASALKASLFTVCLTRHSEIHTNLSAFAFKVSLQAIHDVLGATFGNADDVFGNIYALFLSFYFLKL